MPAILLALFARLPALFSLARFAWLIPGVGVFAAVANVFASVVSFFSSTLGRWVGVALIGLALFMAGDVHRYRVDAKKHKAEIARMVADSKAREQKRDAEAKAAAEQDATNRISAIEAQNTDLQKQVEQYAAEIQKHASVACRLDRNDVKRLRKL